MEKEFDDDTPDLPDEEDATDVLPHAGSEYPEDVAGVAPSGSIVRYDPLQRYLAEVRRYPFLTREEEHELFMRFKRQNDREAVSGLILSHLRFVVSIAMEYRQAPIPVMDLIQEGNIGLMMAIKKFDPARKTRLSTYAAWWIRAYILRYIMQNWRLVRMGTTQAQRKLFYNLRKEKGRLENEGFALSTKLIADRLDVKESEVIEMDQRLDNWDVSLDAPIGPDGGDSPLRQVPSSVPGPDEEVADRDLKRMFRSKLGEFREALKPADRMVLDERILAEEPKTLEVLGVALGISRERARQIEGKVIRNLKKFMKREMKDFDVLAFDEPQNARRREK